MRVAVVDIGSNSTRLLVADVDARPDAAITEVLRRSTVTRLGEGVESTGQLSEAAQARVLAVLADYAAAIDGASAGRRVAVMTSAVRDAANGPAFARAASAVLAAPARTLSGEEEARVTFAGATAVLHAREAPPEPLLVADIGGGSTELVVGHRGTVDAHASLQAGVVRHSERHLAHDPPWPQEVAAFRVDVRALVEDAMPAATRRAVRGAIAVAGTAMSCAAITLEMRPYEPARLEGHALEAHALTTLCDRLVALSPDERAALPGLHPARSPTIVAGALLLDEVLAAFDLPRVTVSDRDVLWGSALALAREPD